MITTGIHKPISKGSRERTYYELKQKAEKREDWRIATNPEAGPLTKEDRLYKVDDKRMYTV